MDDEDNGIGVGVFFSNSKAVTADHNLTVDQALGTKIVVKIPGITCLLIGRAFHVCKQLSDWCGMPLQP